jgi:uncharacterized protein (DUF924 family)/tRNA(Ile)-lysidine synthase TilS/MesJ
MSTGSTQSLDEEADQVLKFWFDPYHLKFHFSSTPAFDETIRTRFAHLLQADLSRWSEHPRNALAAIIVLDQFTRNLFRGHTSVFRSYGPRARLFSAQILLNDWGKVLTPTEYRFVLLPLRHSREQDLVTESINRLVDYGQRFRSDDRFPNFYKASVEAFVANLESDWPIPDWSITASPLTVEGSDHRRFSSETLRSVADRQFLIAPIDPKHVIYRSVQRCVTMNRIDRAFIALSGGKDSMAVLAVLLQLRASGIISGIDAYHINYCNKVVSFLDEFFVRDFCLANDIDLRIRRMPVLRTSDYREPYEVLTRNTRFSDYAKIAQGRMVFLGSNGSDAFENFFANLKNRSKYEDLASISFTSHVSGVDLCRPLFRCSNDAVYQFMSDHQIPHTRNTTPPDCFRGRIRKSEEFLQRHYPRLRFKIIEASDKLSRLYSFLYTLIDLVIQNATIESEQFTLKIDFENLYPPIFWETLLPKLFHRMERQCNRRVWKLPTKGAMANFLSLYPLLIKKTIGHIKTQTRKDFQPNPSQDPLPPFDPEIISGLTSITSQLKSRYGLVVDFFQECCDFTEQAGHEFYVQIEDVLNQIDPILDGNLTKVNSMSELTLEEPLDSRDYLLGGANYTSDETVRVAEKMSGILLSTASYLVGTVKVFTERHEETSLKESTDHLFDYLTATLYVASNCLDILGLNREAGVIDQLIDRLSKQLSPRGYGPGSPAQQSLELIKEMLQCDRERFQRAIEANRRQVSLYFRSSTSAGTVSQTPEKEIPSRESDPSRTTILIANDFHQVSRTLSRLVTESLIFGRSTVLSQVTERTVSGITTLKRLMETVKRTFEATHEIEPQAKGTITLVDELIAHYRALAENYLRQAVALNERHFPPPTELISEAVAPTETAERSPPQSVEITEGPKYHPLKTTRWMKMTERIYFLIDLVNQTITFKLRE